VTAPEAARHDLYTGLVDVLGEERARTLMAHLPTSQSADLATRSDLAEVRDEIKASIDALGNRIDALSVRMEDRFHKLTLTIVAGLFVIVGAMAGVFTASLL
jgi:hypothetical protein